MIDSYRQVPCLVYQVQTKFRAEARPRAGLVRLREFMTCIIAQNHDADGIMWPSEVAPYRFHLLAAGKDPGPAALAESLYAALGPDQVLFDDRDLSPGVKFQDADLLGMPIRITVSARSGGGCRPVAHLSERTQPRSTMPRASRSTANR